MECGRPQVDREQAVAAETRSINSAQAHGEVNRRTRVNRQAAASTLPGGSISE